MDVVLGARRVDTVIVGDPEISASCEYPFDRLIVEIGSLGVIEVGVCPFPDSVVQSENTVRRRSAPIGGESRRD